MPEVNCCDPQVDTCEWEDHKPPNQPYTYKRVARRKTVPEVLDEIKAVLGVDDWGYCDYPGVDEYLGAQNDGEWPEGRIVVFSVNGSNEGDYVHVEVHAESRTRCLILGKTLQGRDFAWDAARRIADLLGA